MFLLLIFSLTEDKSISIPFFPPRAFSFGDRMPPTAIPFPACPHYFCCRTQTQPSYRRRNVKRCLSSPDRFLFSVLPPTYLLNINIWGVTAPHYQSLLLIIRHTPPYPPQRPFEWPWRTTMMVECPQIIPIQFFF